MTDLTNDGRRRGMTGMMCGSNGTMRTAAIVPKILEILNLSFRRRIGRGIIEEEKGQQRKVKKKVILF